MFPVSYLLSLPLSTHRTSWWAGQCSWVAVTIVACSLAMVVLIGRSADLPVPAYLPVMSLAAGLRGCKRCSGCRSGYPGYVCLSSWRWFWLRWRFPLLGSGRVSPRMLVLVNAGGAVVGSVPGSTWPAYHGPGAGRCRAGGVSGQLWEPSLAVLPRRRGAFRSAAHAQLWLEWRLNGVALPFITAFFLLAFAALILMNQHNHRMAADSLLRSPLLLFLLAPWIALTAGFHFGNLPTVANDRMISPFIATRPIRATDIVLAKFRAAAISVVALFGHDPDRCSGVVRDNR